MCILVPRSRSRLCRRWREKRLSEAVRPRGGVSYGARTHDLQGHKLARWRLSNGYRVRMRRLARFEVGSGYKAAAWFPCLLVPCKGAVRRPSGVPGIHGVVHSEALDATCESRLEGDREGTLHCPRYGIPCPTFMPHYRTIFRGGSLLCVTNGLYHTNDNAGTRTALASAHR